MLLLIVGNKQFYLNNTIDKYVKINFNCQSKTQILKIQQLNICVTANRNSDFLAVLGSRK